MKPTAPVFYEQDDVDDATLELMLRVLPVEEGKERTAASVHRALETMHAESMPAEATRLRGSKSADALKPKARPDTKRIRRIVTT